MSSVDEMVDAFASGYKMPSAVIAAYAVHDR